MENKRERTQKLWNNKPWILSPGCCLWARVQDRFTDFPKQQKERRAVRIGAGFLTCHTAWTKWMNKGERSVLISSDLYKQSALRHWYISDAHLCARDNGRLVKHTTRRDKQPLLNANPADLIKYITHYRHHHLWYYPSVFVWLNKKTWLW